LRWASGRLPAGSRALLDTEDLVQETLAGAVRQIEKFEPKHQGAFHAYLRQAIKNRIRDAVRKAARSSPATPLPPGARDPGASPLEATIGREALERYEAALARLPEDQREAVVARIEMDMSYEEIARAVGKPSPDAARMTVTRALARLAKELGHES
jgi:RNA polymerase sigma-70 factor (ECF subfamily)